MTASTESPVIDQLVYDEHTAAQMLMVQPQTLAAWRSRGQGPAFVRVGRAVRYLRSDLEQFLRAGRVDPTATRQA